MLHGNGSILYENGKAEQVYWFQGRKLKHFKNFLDKDEICKILGKIQ